MSEKKTKVESGFKTTIFIKCGVCGNALPLAIPTDMDVEPCPWCATLLDVRHMRNADWTN